MVIKRLIGALSNRAEEQFSIPPGQRVYAVGDIHGRLDLLDRMLDKIADDDANRQTAATTIIFLGDLVDRGPDSFGVVQRLLSLSREPFHTRFLMGNHEQVFLRAARGDAKATRYLVRMGGKSTILSYGITEEEYIRLDFEELTEAFASRVPSEHLSFLSGFEDWIEIGNYLFVHAGVRPGVELTEQKAEDLYWIRGEFLGHKGSFGKMVVHGHTITAEPDVRSNRIGIDVGAFASGRLVAIGLEGGKRWYLTARMED